MIEKWKDISGFEGCYQISDCGRLRSVDRILSYNGKKRNHIGRIISPSIAVGYNRCSLWKNNKPNEYKIHILVAKAFIPNPYGKPCVNHKDGNKLNNHVDNLEWCSYSENMYHSFVNLNRKSKPAKKLSDKDVIEIRKWKATTNITYAQLSLYYNIHPANLSNIVNHKARINAYDICK